MLKLFEATTPTLIEGKMELIEEMTTIQIKCYVYQVVYQNGKVGLRSYQKPCYFKNWKYFNDLLLIIVHLPF